MTKTEKNTLLEVLSVKKWQNATLHRFLSHSCSDAKVA